MSNDRFIFSEMMREPVIRLVVVHVFFIFLSALIVFMTSYIADNYYEKPLVAKIENQNNKRKLASILVRELLKVENDFKSLLLYDNNHRVDYYQKQIYVKMENIDKLVAVLSGGGSYSDSLLVNFYDNDVIYDELIYYNDLAMGYNVEYIDLKPKLNDLRKAIDYSALLKKHGASVSGDYELILSAKGTESLLQRTMESANRIFYDISQSNEINVAGINETRSRVNFITAIITTLSIFFVLIIAVIITVKIYAIVRAKRLIQAHNQWLSAVVNQSPSSIVITDTSGLVEYVNPFFETTSGYNFCEVKGHSTNILKSNETPDEVYTDLWSTIVSGGTWRGELCNKAKDGHLFYEEVVISPVVDEVGVIVNYAAVKLDITERKSMIDRHERLSFEQEQLKAILDHVPFGVVLVDSIDKTIHWANNFARNLSKFEDLGGHQCDELLEWCPADSAGEVSAHESVLHTADMTAIPILKTAQHLRWFNTDVVLTTFLDVSHQKRLEAEIAQKSKLESVGSLSAGIAHELNTPIQYIIHNLHFLHEVITELFCPPPEHANHPGSHKCCECDKEMIAEVLSAISDSVEGAGRIAGLVGELKEFSHPGGGSFERSDINRLIANTIAVCRNEWKYVSNLTFAGDSSLPLVLCDSGAIQQVMLNLIVNARDAIAERLKGQLDFFGKIEVSTTLSGRFVNLVIKDDGVGIEERILQRVFDPFFTTKSTGNGTGQGLYICRNVIVNKHQGEISINSDCAVGTEVVVLLPIDGKE